MAKGFIDGINIGDEDFFQYINTENDSVTIEQVIEGVHLENLDEYDKNAMAVKMTIDSSAKVYDEHGVYLGKFHLTGITGRYIWEYIAEDGSLNRTFKSDLLAAERELFQILYSKGKDEVKV